jgi:uncharacterized membrane protein YedE/YeeE
MKRSVSAFAAGALFAGGLGISGMTLPDKVIGFLDVTGQWDASLAFVMIGALSVHVVCSRLILRRATPIFGGVFSIPTRRDIDGRLVAGAAIFGLGWGLGGYCPGPVLTSLVTLTAAPLIFVAAMAAGMGIQRLTGRAEAPEAVSSKGE